MAGFLDQNSSPILWLSPVVPLQFDNLKKNLKISFKLEYLASEFKPLIGKLHPGLNRGA